MIRDFDSEGARVLLFSVLAIAVVMALLVFGLLKDTEFKLNRELEQRAGLIASNQVAALSDALQKSTSSEIDFILKQLSRVPGFAYAEVSDSRGYVIAMVSRADQRHDVVSVSQPIYGNQTEKLLGKLSLELDRANYSNITQDLIRSGLGFYFAAMIFVISILGFATRRLFAPLR